MSPTDNPLRLAVPSKGRLFQPMIDFLNACGFATRRREGDRAYTLKLSGLDEVVVDLASAGEIPALLTDGKCHLGLTGLDVVAEHLGRVPPSIADGREDGVEDGGADGQGVHALPHLLLSLSLGHADLEVAVPRAWIDVSTMADLADVARRYRSDYKQRLRVATKYMRLTRSFLDACGVHDYRIVESAGATEAAPSSGIADVIVDISSTGATLAANHLKTLRDGRILRSEAGLFIAPAAWARPAPEWLGALEKILTMMDARLAGQAHKELRASLDFSNGQAAGRTAAQQADQIVRALEALGVKRVELIGEGREAHKLTKTHVLSIQAILRADQVYEAVSRVKNLGAAQCLVSDTELLFETGPNTYRKTVERLKLV